MHLLGGHRADHGCPLLGNGHNLRLHVEEGGVVKGGEGGLTVEKFLHHTVEARLGDCQRSETEQLYEQVAVVFLFQLGQPLYALLGGSILSRNVVGHTVVVDNR